MLVVSPEVDFFGDRPDFIVENGLVVFDQQKRLRNLYVLLVYLFDLDVDGVHFVDALHYLFLLKPVLLIWVEIDLLMS